MPLYIGFYPFGVSLRGYMQRVTTYTYPHIATRIIAIKEGTMPSLTMHGCDVRITNKAIEGGDTLQQISEQLDDIANAIITIELMLNNNPQYTKQIATAYKATQKIRDIIKGEINIQIGGIYE